MGFFDLDRWNEIAQTISRNRKRSVMTALGIFWGLFMLIVLLGAGQGLGRMVHSVLGDFSVNSVFFFANPTSLPYKGMPTDRMWHIENDDLTACAALPETRHVGAIIFGPQFYCVHANNRGQYTVSGQTPSIQQILPQQLLYGRFLNDIDMTQKRKVCVIGSQVWRDLFPNGDDPTGQTLKVGNSYFTVIGVLVKKSEVQLGEKPEKSIYLPLTLTQQMFGRGNSVDMIAIVGHDDVPSKHLERRSREVIFSRHLIHPDDTKAVWTISVGDMFDQLQKLFGGIALLTWIVGLGTLLAGVVGVTNIMLVLVKERTQEIGIRRALGARPLTIISQILSESFVLTFVAGILGLAAAVGLLSLVDSLLLEQLAATGTAPVTSVQIDFGTCMLGLAILVTCSIAAGIIPARRALKIKAVDAIREE